MKIIITFLACALPLMTFAGWENYPENTKEVESQWFYINKTCKTAGIHLIGVQSSVNNMVRLRFRENKLDIDCMIVTAEYSKEGSYHIEFFDEDHYFLGERYLGNTDAGFTGSLYDSIEISKELFSKIKQYEIIMRAKVISRN